MSLASYLRHFVSGETVLYECRNCGQTLESEAGPCPACGSEETVEYEFLE